MRLIDAVALDAALGRDESAVWIKYSEIYRYLLFPESHNFFLSSWHSESVSVF